MAFLPDGDVLLTHRLSALDCVEQVLMSHANPPLASRDVVPDGSVVFLGPQLGIGGEGFVVIAGPCAVEGREQVSDCADLVRRGGAGALRGGGFKPRTSPYDFQGLGIEGVRMLAEAGREVGLPVVTEVVEPGHARLVAEHADMLQIGTRNAQNFSLLAAVAETGLPVLLKRGFGCTIKEWLYAAEYVLARGNPNVVLCERGIRTFEGATRFTLDLSAVPMVKQLSHLPVLVDPSHGTGNRGLVEPMALAAAAAGADGLLIDVHSDAATARCDADQALRPAEWLHFADRLAKLLTGLGRPLLAPLPAFPVGP
ncbi:3-deoxy-7-phosphoheptulonate synthase [Micromonospora sp. NBC_01740]|uniref:3-deoxy-7-phosphoheptulonate synthase n=1 Tax=Micromonospora sp. NBC_01740 TaxID=2975986 RepID=UPI002E113F2A|nr:3-deoxy-7-phosphoheptulonate synthase [Micromonospora sp. NBC_01740]